VTDLVYTDAAERDLTQISLYIGADNPRAAGSFVTRIRDHCALLAHFPEMGPRRPEFTTVIRSLAHGSYVIYYRWLEDVDQIHILRIWHGRRRVPTAADLI